MTPDLYYRRLCAKHPHEYGWPAFATAEGRSRVIAAMAPAFSYYATPESLVLAASWVDKLKGVPAKAKSAFVHEMKHQVEHVSHNLKLTKDSVALAFQEPRALNVLKACGYSLATAYGAFHMAHAVAQQGALHVIAHLAEHEVAHKAGHAAGHRADKIQGYLNKYPVLKKLSGPALAGVMLYGWTCAPLHKLEDWDMKNVKRALSGDFTIKEFLASPEAVALGVHVASGKVLSLSALAENVGTLATGLVATTIIHSDNPKLKKAAASIGDAYKKFKSDKTPLHDIQFSEGWRGDEKTMGLDPDSMTKNRKVPVDDGEPKSESAPAEKPKADAPKNEDTKPDATEKPAPDAKPGKTAGGKWWSRLSKGRQRAYLKEHPTSDLKVGASTGEPMQHVLAAVAHRVRVVAHDTDVNFAQALPVSEQVRVAQYMQKKLQMGTLHREHQGVLGIGLSDMPEDPKAVVKKMDWLGWSVLRDRFNVLTFGKPGVNFNLSYYKSARFLAAPQHMLPKSQVSASRIKRRA